MIKKDKGITLISLSIAVIIILTITGMILYSAKDNIYIKNLTNMENDIANLRDKISSYYSEYGDIPAQTEYPDITNLENAGVIGANDTGKFYIIELEKLDGLTLNYGEDYEKYKANGYTYSSDLTDIYIINENSHNIFFVEGIRVKENNETKMYYTDYTEGDTQNVEMKIVDEVIIPNKFYYVGGTRDSGLVISDDPRDENAYENEERVGNDLQGNQFVWIPVDQENFEKDFVRRAGYSDGKEQVLHYGEADGTGNNTDEEVIETNTTKIEAQEMYASVEKYGGFYIGRYEAGKDAEENVLVKQAVDVYNEIPWSANGNNIQETNGTTGGAIELSRNFDTANGYTNVTSTLIYSVQWDATMKWMENIENPNATGSLTKYIQDSTGMGWYGNNSGNVAHQTGDDIDTQRSNCINNIYDLAGNVWEWTMESVGIGGRVYRGGSYGSKGATAPASNRYAYAPATSISGVGFRIALYLNVDDLETPVDLPAVKIKEFTIDGEVYKFEEGMNFGTWINSKYNTNEWKISPSSYITNSTYTKTVRDLNGNLVYYNTNIAENVNYTTWDI